MTTISSSRSIWRDLAEVGIFADIVATIVVLLSHGRGSVVASLMPCQYVTVAARVWGAVGVISIWHRFVYARYFRVTDSGGGEMSMGGFLKRSVAFLIGASLPTYAFIPMLLCSV